MWLYPNKTLLIEARGGSIWPKDCSKPCSEGTNKMLTHIIRPHISFNVSF